MVIIVFGLPGSGKTYFSTRVAEMLGAKYISSDRVRKEFYIAPAYSSKEKVLIYNEMLKRMVQAAEHGKEVVVDGTFFTNDLREKFLSEAQKITHVFLIELFADEDVIEKRLAQPREDSSADFKVYQSIKKAWEPFSADHHLFLYSTNHNITEMLEQTADYLFSRNNKTKD